MGMKTAASVAVVETTAKNTSRVPITLAARTDRPMFAPADDVLQHDDRVVDDHAGRQHQRQERDDVDGEADEIDARHHADQGDRDCEGRDQRRPEVHQEGVDDGDDDDDGERQRQLDLVDRAVMKVASSEVTMTRVPGGRDVLSSATAARTPSEIARVEDPGLPDDAEADAGLAV